MKKVLLAIVVLFGSMAFMSCKRDYTCVCITIDSSGFYGDMTNEKYVKSTKSKISDVCQKLESSEGTLTTTCSVK